MSLDKVPLSGGTVTFYFVGDDESVRPGIAQIDAQGRYRVGNANLDKPAGLMPGEYRVTVLWMGSTGAADQGGTKPIPEIVSRLPERYADVETTPLLVRVSEGENRVDLKLSTQPQ